MRSQNARIDAELRAVMRELLRLDWSALPFGFYRIVGEFRSEGEAILQRMFAGLQSAPPERLAEILACADGLFGPPAPPARPPGGVAFTWQGADAYFVRSGEIHRDHLLEFGEFRLALRVVEAERERGNNKATASRRVLLAEPEALHLEPGGLTVRLCYRVPAPHSSHPPSQRALNAAMEARILAALPPERAERLRGGALLDALTRANRREREELLLWPDLRGRVQALLDAHPGLRETIGPALLHRVALEERLCGLLLRRRLVLQEGESEQPFSTELDIHRPGGVALLQGSNLDALRLLGPGLQGAVQAIYIDPPYNTGEPGFAYKDRLSHAAWLTLLRQALDAARPLAADSAMLAISINETELANLMLLCRNLLGESAFSGLFTVRVRHEDRILKRDKETHEVTEYLLLYKLGPRARAGGRPPREDSADYRWHVELLGGPARVELRGGKRVEVYTPGQFGLREGPGGHKRINIRGSLRKANSSGRFYVAHVEPDFAALRGCLLRVAGMGADGLGARDFWVPPEESRRKNPDYFQGRPLRGGEASVPYPNLLDFEPQFNRVAREGGVEFRDGKKPVAFLEHALTLCGVASRRDAVVLDFFAGSGSTGQAVLAMNARDGGQRRAVLVEMGEYAADITRPRLRNAARGAGLEAPLASFALEDFDDVAEAPPEHTGEAPLREPWRPADRGRQVDWIASITLLFGLREPVVEHFAEGLVRLSGRDPGGAPVCAVLRSASRWPDAPLLGALGELPPGPIWVNGGCPGGPFLSLEDALRGALFRP